MHPFPLILLVLCLAPPCLWAGEHEFQLLKKPLFFKVHASAYSHTQPEYLKGQRIGAFGSYLKASKTYNSVAADWSFLPMGSVFRIKSYGQTQFVVDDHLESVAGKAAIKIYFNLPREARQWKTRHLEIEVLRVGDFKASYHSLRARSASDKYCRTMAQRIYRRLQGDDYRDFRGGNGNIGTTKYIKPEDLPTKTSDAAEAVSQENMGALFPGL